MVADIKMSSDMLSVGCFGGERVQSPVDKNGTFFKLKGGRDDESRRFVFNLGVQFL
jgi:hypothetical protein